LVRGCSFVIVPSRWYENNPMTIVEAYAYGKPVIGARIGGIPEILEGQGTGFIYPSGDVEALAGALSEASAVSDEAYAEMSARARAFYEANFAEAPYYDKLMNFYQGILDNKK
ncbi:MAG: glycosyltransferase family 4 protein, partial [Bacteroidales bacterium]|nr:glycosyltransferase family 4 protein [Bacteroidales bacterium]